MEEYLPNENCIIEDKHVCRNFLLLERQYDIDNTVNIILNFKKLKIDNEYNFLQIINLYENNIRRDIGKIKEKLEAINNNSLNNKDNKKELIIQWELDLSYNYFKDISIDNILSILIDQNIINEQENSFHLGNLKTLNLRKNCLTKFPYICKHKLPNLTTLCLSHNDINEIVIIDTKNKIEKNYFEKNINIDKDEGILNKIIPNLKNIYLQNNNIDSFNYIIYLFNHHKEITNINISFNKINYLNNFPFLKSLEYLDVSFNNSLNYNSKDIEYKNITVMELENYYKRGNVNLNIDDEKDFIFFHFLFTLEKFFPNLNNINIKNTPMYSLIKYNIKRKKNSLIYFPF